MTRAQARGHPTTPLARRGHGPSSTADTSVRECRGGGGRASSALPVVPSVGTPLPLAAPPPAPTSAPAIFEPDTCPLPLPLPLKDSIARAALPVSLKVGLPLVRSGGGGGGGPPELLVIERGCEQQASNSLLTSCLVEHEVCVRRFQ